MGVLGRLSDFIRSFRVRRRKEAEKEREEVELGERVNPALLRGYGKDDVWSKLDPINRRSS